MPREEQFSLQIPAGGGEVRGQFYHSREQQRPTIVAVDVNSTSMLLGKLAPLLSTQGNCNVLVVNAINLPPLLKPEFHSLKGYLAVLRRVIRHFSLVKFFYLATGNFSTLLGLVYETCFPSEILSIATLDWFYTNKNVDFTAVWRQDIDRLVLNQTNNKIHCDQVISEFNQLLPGITLNTSILLIYTSVFPSYDKNTLELVGRLAKSQVEAYSLDEGRHQIDRVSLLVLRFFSKKGLRAKI